MKCKRQPVFLAGRPTPITDVWEVRLPTPLFSRVKAIAHARKVTYSTVTRFCVFRLSSFENLRFRRNLHEARDQVRALARRGPSTHRHLVCLYGDDVRYLQLAAMRLRISVSELIRIALWLYLPRLAMDIHSYRAVTDAALFWQGTKHWLYIHHNALNLLHAPAIRQFTFASFTPVHWWPPKTG